MRKNPNKSFYHYSSEEYDKEGNLIDIRFYMTLFDLVEKFNKSRFTFNMALNDPDRVIKSLPNFKFKRVRIPVYKQVINDVFSEGLLDEYNTDSSDDNNKEVEYIEDLPNGTKNVIYADN